MIEQSFFQSNFLGRDGFKWWIGQVADPESSGWSRAATLVEKEDCQYYRVKVRILGYHPSRNKLADQDLPFAHVLVPLGQGTGVNNIAESHDIQGGESVLGFFADGDDCQQPIIFGAFYRQRDQTDETFAEGEDATFNRFSGKKSLPDTEQNHLSEKTDSSGGTNVATGESSTPATPTQQPPGIPLNPTKALAAHALLSNVTVTPPNPCQNNDISRIQTILVDFMNRMKQIQFFLDSYVDPILNELVNLDDEILRFTKLILGVVSGQIAKLRDYLMAQIGKAIAPLLASLFPKSQQPVLGQTTKTILDLIFCLLEQLLQYLFDIIKQLLTDLLDNLFDIVQCTLDNFLDDIFIAVNDFIGKNLTPLLEDINSVFGGALGSVTNILSQALGYAGLALNLITNCNSDCPTPSTWSASGGLTFNFGDDFNTLIDQLGGRDFGPCDNSLNCQTGISITGGGGSGAYAEPIVSDGQIIGVNLIDSGFGYLTLPSISIQDNCGGYGGELIPIIDPGDGGVIDVIVDEPGDDYHDGGTRNSSGIFMGDLSGDTAENGRTATFKVCLKTQPTRDVIVNLTVQDLTEGRIDRSQLTFTRTNWNVKQTVTVTGVDDNIFDGDITYTIRAVSSSRQPIYNSRTANIQVTNLDNDGGSTRCTNNSDCPEGYICRNGVCVQIDNPTPEPIGPITKCGFIAGILVKKIGYNYSSSDTVSVYDRDGNLVPEVKINLVLGPNNSIIAAEITASAIFCGYLPEIRINTKTGSGAILKPSLKYQGITPKDPESVKQISIIDCISK